MTAAVAAHSKGSAAQDIPSRVHESWLDDVLATPSFDGLIDDVGAGASGESGPSSYLQTPPLRGLALPLSLSPLDADLHHGASFPSSSLTKPTPAAQYRSSPLNTRLIPLSRPLPPLDILTAGIGELARALDSRELTSVRAIKIYLAQIERWNGYLHALTYVAARELLLEQARECDRAIRSEGFDRRQTPLCGIPIIVKDNIGTGPDLGMPTTAGSLALLHNTPRYDSHVVKRLRDAGAIIIGKANMTELASYRSRTVPNGWSAAGGQTVNAYAAHLCPGSSSSGNAVAAAAGFCPLSIGTETDGSITLPAMQSALYALKPTIGMVSRAGCVPFAQTFDTPGPMAKDVWSVAVGLDVISGMDEDDEETVDVPRLPRSLRYVDFCVRPSFANLRIGIPRANWFTVDPWNPNQPYYARPSVLKAFHHSLQIMSSLGATVVDNADIPSVVDGSFWRCMRGARGLIVKADFADGLSRYLRETSQAGGSSSIEDVVEFNKSHAVLELPPGCSGQELLEGALVDTISVDSNEYQAAKEEMRQVAGVNGLDAVLDGYDLDAIMCLGHGKHSLSSMSGAPIGVVPLGLMEDGEPIGAYFIARRGGEGTLLRIMAAWERASEGRPVPPL